MNQQLFEDARNGHTARIISNLQYNPEMSWTPLHIACLYGKENFAMEFLLSNPEFLKLVNTDGCTALHLASSNGHSQVVDLLLTFPDPDHNQTVIRELCMKKDKYGKTPLHHAVVKESVQVVKKLLETCPESALELTDEKQTVFHLAVKNKVSPSSQVFKALLDGPYASHLLNLDDKEGNTVLHLAIIRKQTQIIKLLIAGDRNLNVNAVNSSGLTPLDALVVDPMSRKDKKIERMIISAGGIRLNESNEQRENLSSMASGLLVMASLGAAASCQIAVYIQGDFWRDSILNPDANITSISNSTTTLEKPWNATLYNQDDVEKKYVKYSKLVVFDILLFFSSLLLIVFLLFPTPTKYNNLRWMGLRFITYMNAVAFVGLFRMITNSRKNALYEVVVWPFYCIIFPLIAFPLIRIWKIHRKWTED